MIGRAVRRFDGFPTIGESSTEEAIATLIQPMNRHQRRASAKQSARSSSPQRSDTPAGFFEAGLRLLKAGQLSEAEKCGKKALAIDAGHADSLHLMGLLCLAAKQNALAVEWFAQAIRQDANVADYFSNLGTALQQQGRLDDAVKSFDRALVLKPDLAEVWYKLGEVLQQQKRYDEAILSFDQALTRNPQYREAANASALLHFDAGRYDEAIARFDRSLEIAPGQAGAFHLKAICQLRLQRFAEALVNCSKALELAPDNPEITNNVGLILQRLARNEEALGYFDRAIALRPQFSLAFSHRGTSLSELRRFDDALASFAAATAIDPDYADAHWNRALLQLLLGDFAGGWAAREWGRKSTAVGFVDRQFTKPIWLGEAPIADKTILLHSDEGLGDTIQFARYATMVAQRGARVILEVQDFVQPLLSGIEGVSLCLPKTFDALPDFDLHCPLSSLPLAFATRLETIPAAPAYLPAPSIERVQPWQDRLGPHDKLRVGLVWSGNPAHGNDRNRSMSLRALSSIIDVDARFISLQKDVRPDDKARLLERTEIADWTGQLSDFAETAALMSCLDLVITVDTSVAHLAGALGRPTWILLPYTPDYRWLLDRDDSPWYPTVRLFRQDERRDYASVLARVRAELESEIAAFRS
jgi:tetratricopeptide (TPR) repeat protein